jgi:hypothetical protein
MARGSTKKIGGYGKAAGPHKSGRAAKLAGAKKGGKKGGIPFGGMKFGGADKAGL